MSDNVGSPEALMEIHKRLEHLVHKYADNPELMKKAMATYHQRERYFEDYVRLCPICRGLPRIKYEFTGDSTWCSLSCGPWYWKKHFRCAAGVAGTSPLRALMHAVAGWNERVEQYYKDHPTRHPPVSD